MTLASQPASRDLGLHGIDPERLPRHVAIIMDGNGRWAQNRGLNRLYGHRRGKASVRAIVQLSHRLGIEYLSLYAFSAENWNRPASEVSGLMRLLKHYLTTELDRMMKDRVRPARDRQPPQAPARRPAGAQALRREDQGQRSPDGDPRALVQCARGDRGRRARDRAAREARRPRAEAITEDTIAQSLGTANIPDPDLLIRTSGEVRLSNFLLWQVAYTEIYITETLWPDFRERDFLEALRDFQSRERRFGGLAEMHPGQARLRAAR
jgi:undecaprenyl diphosphate synthase